MVVHVGGILMPVDPVHLQLPLPKAFFELAP